MNLNIAPRACTKAANWLSKKDQARKRQITSAPRFASVVGVGASSAVRWRRAATRPNQLSSKLTVFLGVGLDEADCGQLSLIPYFEGADGHADRLTDTYRPARRRRKRRCLSTSGAPAAAIGTLTNSQVGYIIQCRIKSTRGEVINERT